MSTQKNTLCFNSRNEDEYEAKDDSKDAEKDSDDLMAHEVCHSDILLPLLCELRPVLGDPGRPCAWSPSTCQCRRAAHGPPGSPGLWPLGSVEVR